MKKDKDCFDCKHSIAMGCGDFLCGFSGVPKVVLQDYIPTKHFIWCEKRKKEVSQ